MAGRLSGAILAAGRGERLRPASGEVPKPLVDLGGQPLLLRQIDLLLGVGASPVNVIVNSETDRLMRLRGLRLPDATDLLVCDTANSMESLLKLGERIAPGRFVLMTVDAVLYASDIRNFVTNATKLCANPELRLDGALGMVKWLGDLNPLFVQFKDDGEITALGDRQSSTVTAGIYLFSTAIFGHAGEARRRGLDAMRRFLAMLLEEGMRFGGLEVPRAIDVDGAADLSAAHEMLARESEWRRSKPE
jgi:NDP-sugar pyrophosphorylase family protein